MKLKCVLIAESTVGKAIRDDLTRINDALTKFYLSQGSFLSDNLEDKFHQSLLPPYPSPNHNAACKKQQTETGQWFIDDC